MLPMDSRRLISGARSFGVSFAPAFALAGCGAVGALLQRRIDLMTVGLFAWLAVGGLLIVLQVISWWGVHFLLLLVPLGLLAAQGLDAARQRLKSWLQPAPLRVARIALAFAVVLGFAPQLRSASHVTVEFWRGRPFPLSEQGIAAYHREHHPGYAAIAARTAFLRDPHSHPGPIYVVDSPAYYLHAHRPPAVSLLAPWFHPTDRLWKRLIGELEHARPPYVRLSEWALDAIVEMRPSLGGDVAALVALIKTHYDILNRDAQGTGYVRRDLVAGR